MAASPAPAADEPLHLLQLDYVTVERVSSPGVALNRVALLADRDAQTACVFPAAGGVPVDIIYHFDGKTVSPEQLVVQLPPNVEAAKPGLIEILASSLSADAGYRLLRSDPLQATSQPQKFPFQPAAARWILIRITPGSEAAEAAVAELAVLGREGPPVSHYEFKESPAETFEVLKHLQDSDSVDISVSEDEAALFADAQDGRLDSVSFADAALLASGVIDQQQRRRYLEQIDALEGQARTALTEQVASFARADRLLQWLHENVLSGGYSAGQSDTRAVLETGIYNCVSSATIYNILGRRVDLDLRAIEVPDHAFSILYDGTQHADVETTNPRGFNPARNPEVVRELEEQNALRYIPERDRAKRREIRDAGLVALIYYNRGVQLTEQKDYAEALGAYFRALSLDRECASAVQNVLAVLANWSKELADNGNHEQALDVVATGLQLAPENATLQHNQEAIWTNWANAAIDSGQTEEALAILERAQAADPDGGFHAMQSWVFIRPAEKLIEEGNWDEALSLAGRGLSRIEGAARGELEKWRNGVFLRWSNAELEEGRFRQSADVLARALEVDPDEKRFENNLGYIAQQWSWAVYAQDGTEKAQPILAELQERFPEVAAVVEAAENFVVRVVNEFREAGRYEEALYVVAQTRDLLQDENTRWTLLHSIYDDWANSISKTGQWEAALEIYDKALEKHPADKHLQNNAVATWDAWAQVHMQDGDWESAASVYEKALEKHPDSQHFRQNLGYVAAQLAQTISQEKDTRQSVGALAELIERHPNVGELKQAAESHLHQSISQLLGHGQFEAALQTINHFEATLDQPQRLKAVRIVYDRWADHHLQGKQWKKAVEVYGAALEQYPGDSHLSNNALATWNSWAATHIQAKQWGQAIDVYDQALKAFPDNATLKNNLKYCQQQLNDGEPGGS